MTAPPPAVLAQLERLELVRGRPLFVVDADEVLFAFMEELLTFFAGRGLGFEWRSFALQGNVIDAAGVPVTQEVLRGHLGEFFVARTEALAPVPGAAEGLKALAALGVQIVVLSNVPPGQQAARARALAAGGMDWPLIANEGRKGPAVRWLAERVAAPVAFVDDIGHQHESVAAEAPQVFRIQFSAHPRLRELQVRSPAVQHVASDWEEIAATVAAHLLPG